MGFAFAGVWQGVIDVARSVADLKLPIDINVAAWKSPSESGTRSTCQRIACSRSPRPRVVLRGRFARPNISVDRGYPMKRLALFALLIAAPLAAQRTAHPRRGGRGAGRGGGGGWNGAMDSARIRQLYVSKDPADLRGCGSNCERDMAGKRKTDSVYAAKAPGNYEFQKIKYKSRVDGLEIPAYVFSPIKKSATKHAALVWVHGGVHGDWNTGLYPFIVEAVKRGYVILTPDYRGSTGYGDEFHRKIDYGGKEVDDVLSSVDYLATLPYVDSNRLGIMGWSHGGFITSHILFRDGNPFKAGAAIVPVTNLVFRLSDHGPGYAARLCGRGGNSGTSVRA